MPKTLFTDSNYKVTEEGNIRSLSTSNSLIQSVLDTNSPHKLCLPFWQALELIPIVQQSLQKVLILGLGGGSLPHFFSKFTNHIAMTVVELDSNIVQIAKDYFLIDDLKLSIINSNALDYIESIVDSFDVIVIDIFDDSPDGAQSTLPSRFYEKCCDLTKDGIVVSNRVFLDKNKMNETLTNLTKIRTASPISFFSNSYQNLVTFSASSKLIDSYLKAVEKNPQYHIAYETEAHGVFIKQYSNPL